MPRKPRFDGFYVLRTSLAAEPGDAAGTVRASTSLAQLERAFRCIKTLDLELRPVFHWTAPRVRAHVLACMLAYYLEWHMRQPLAPMLFDDQPFRRRGRAGVAGGQGHGLQGGLSEGLPTAHRRRQWRNQPVHSLRTLLGDLATLTRNTVCFTGQRMLTIQTTPTPIQRRAFSLLGIALAAA